MDGNIIQQFTAASIERTIAEDEKAGGETAAVKSYKCQAANMGTF